MPRRFARAALAGIVLAAAAAAYDSRTLTPSDVRPVAALSADPSVGCADRSLPAWCEDGLPRPGDSAQRGRSAEGSPWDRAGAAEQDARASGSSQRAQSGDGMRLPAIDGRVLPGQGGEEPADDPPGELVWTGDIETGDLSQFDVAPWNTQAASEPEAVQDETRDGAYAVRFSIPEGAETSSCCGPRSELVPSTPHFRSGDELYFAYSTMLAPGFPTHERWQNIAAWKADPGGSPPLEMGVQDGEYQLAGGFSHPHGSQYFERFLGDAAPGTWADWVIHIKFSVDPAVGFVEVWRDGEIVVPKMFPAGGTLYPTRDPAGNIYPSEYFDTDGEPRGYPKIGYYRRSGIGPAGTVYFDSMKVGTSYDAVARAETTAPTMSTPVPDPSTEPGEEQRDAGEG